MIFVLAFFTVSVLPAKDPGLKAFYRGDHQKAQRYYEKRYEKESGNEKTVYNLGTAELALGNHSKAHDLLKQSLTTEDPVQRARAHYNLGQLAYKQQDMEKASEHFKKSMRYDPRDINSKIMYEHLRELQQQKQEQQEQKQENRGDREKQQEQEDRQERQEEQQQKENNGSGNGEEKKDQQERSEEGSENKTGSQSQLKEEDLKAEELSREQAKNILNAMKEKEKESMKKLILNQSANEKIKRSKEW